MQHEAQHEYIFTVGAQQGPDSQISSERLVIPPTHIALVSLVLHNRFHPAAATREEIHPSPFHSTVIKA